MRQQLLQPVDHPVKARNHISFYPSIRFKHSSVWFTGHILLARGYHNSQTCSSHNELIYCLGAQELPLGIIQIISTAYIPVCWCPLAIILQVPNIHPASEDFGCLASSSTTTDITVLVESSTTTDGQDLVFLVEINITVGIKHCNEDIIQYCSNRRLAEQTTLYQHNSDNKSRTNSIVPTCSDNESQNEHHCVKNIADNESRTKPTLS